MPKRSAEERLERYRNKIRKLESKKKRRRIISSDEDIQEINGNSVPVLPMDVAESIQDITQTEPQPSCSGASDVMGQVAPQEVLLAVSEPEVTLDPELLSALGTAASDTPEYGVKIHESLALLWSPLLKRGLSKEDKNILNKNYLIPENCKLLQAPTLNGEISAAVTEMVRFRDKKLQNSQQQLGAGITATNKAMDLLLKCDDKVQALRFLSDSCRILSGLHFAFTKDRTKLVLPSLDKNFLHVIQDAERDETLFGGSLSEKIKASKAIEKQGLQIKKTAPKVVQSTAVRQTTGQGNWTGPPRYPSNRGGRGGQRRPTSMPAPRRNYQNQTSQNQPKYSSQYRPRAPTQQ